MSPKIRDEYSVDWIFCQYFLHLLSDHRILVPVPIIRALIISVRHDPHIVILVHIHVAQIRAVFIVIDIKRTCLAACPLFAFLFHVFVSSSFLICRSFPFADRHTTLLYWIFPALASSFAYLLFTYSFHRTRSTLLFLPSPGVIIKADKTCSE